RSLVTKDVRAYAVVAGIPAHELRRRFTDDQIARLIKSQWWNWDDAVVRAHAALLQNPDVDKFLVVAEQRRRDPAA
ncbi:MAG: type B chloramphenicol O-acetyltransferase, partial [Ilumatobacteraceae bacterium]